VLLHRMPQPKHRDRSVPETKSIVFAVFICTISAGLVLVVAGAFFLRSTGSDAIKGGTSGNPTLFEVRQQCNEIAAFFPVDLALARRWVPQSFSLAVDAQGNAGGALIFMNCPNYSWLTTPNSPPVQRGENTAPGSVVHLWFMLRGPAQVLPVPGAQVTSPTQYAYAVADLVTSPVAARVYRRAGKNAVMISGTTLIDEGKEQKGKITFINGTTITLDAYTAKLSPTPLRLGGNIWNWHVGSPEELGDNPGAYLDPAVGNLSNVNKTRVMFLATVPGRPNTSQVAIHAEPGTPFVQYYGIRDVVTSRATFLRPNNIANNSSRGQLAWTMYPPYTLNCPPLHP
jgi:hypothetical protein